MIAWVALIALAVIATFVFVVAGIALPTWFAWRG